MMNRMSRKILRFFETGVHEVGKTPFVGIYVDDDNVYVSTDNSIVDISTYGRPNNLITLYHTPEISLLEDEIDKDDCVIVKNQSSLSKYMEYSPDRIVLPFRHGNVSIPLDHTKAICTILAEMYPKEKFHFYIDGSFVKIAIGKNIIAAMRAI